MATKNLGMGVTAVESHQKDFTGEGDGLDSPHGMEMGSQSRGEDENVNPEVLEHGIDALEGQKKAWYTYLTTKDFWIVLLLGYVFGSRCHGSKLMMA